MVADPSLAQMNAAGDHAMGSTIPRPANAQKTFSTQLGVSGVLGMDVSGWQPTVDWSAQWANGARFVYIKSSEGTYYTSSHFPSQFQGATNVGMIRGAYHFATPNTTDGATQARFFYAHGGNWAPDGRTLPPLLDIEYATDGSGTCWGLSQAQMSWWINDFVKTMRSLTGVNPAIYSTANWWNTCTGSNNTFGAYPLFVARYDSSTPGSLPASWLTWTMWQYASSGVFAGDQDIFNGNMGQLQQFALGANDHPPLGNYESASLSSGQPFRVSGWSFDQTNLAATTSVQIQWNTPAGISTTTVASNVSRPDVGAAFPSAGSSHGFSAQAPWAGNGQYGACVTVLALPGDRAGNAMLGCRTAFVSAVVSSAPTSRRLQDTDRFTTAVAVSKDTYPTAGTAAVAYVASGEVYADALSAAPAAAVQHGPVLLTLAASIPTTTMNELQRLKPGKIVVVGGTSSVSDAAYAQLQSLKIPMVRLDGATRVEVARAVADYAFGSAKSAFVATGWSFPDALSAAPAAAKQRVPLLLVDGSGLDANTAAFLTNRKATSVTVAGGPASVSNGWTASAQQEGLTVTRIGGATRFDVSAGLATKYFPDGGSANVYIASGVQWPDALVTSAAAGATGKPLLIANTNCVPRSIGDQLVRLRTTSTTVAGGPNTLTSEVDGLSVCY